MLKKLFLLCSVCASMSVSATEDDKEGQSVKPSHCSGMGDFNPNPGVDPESLQQSKEQKYLEERGERLKRVKKDCFLGWIELVLSSTFHWLGSGSWNPFQTSIVEFTQYTLEDACFNRDLYFREQYGRPREGLQKKVESLTKTPLTNVVLTGVATDGVRRIINGGYELGSIGIDDLKRFYDRVEIKVKLKEKEE